MGVAGGAGISDPSGGAAQCVGGHAESALNALVFLYRHVIGREFGLWSGVKRAKRLQRVPVVLSQAEVQRLLAAVPVKYQLFFKFLYGTGCG